METYPDSSMIVIGGELLALLLMISWVDFKRQVIPDYLNAALALTGLATMLVLESPAVWDAVAGFLLGGAVFWGVRYAYQTYRGVTGLGLGDVKFAAASGLWVGVTGLPWLTLIAAISGLAFMIGLRLIGMPVDGRTRVAFGPHLALALFVTWICKMRGIL